MIENESEIWGREVERERERKIVWVTFPDVEKINEKERIMKILTIPQISMNNVIKMLAIPKISVSPTFIGLNYF